jgi:hypothetical protein
MSQLHQVRLISRQIKTINAFSGNHLKINKQKCWFEIDSLKIRVFLYLTSEFELINKEVATIVSENNSNANVMQCFLNSWNEIQGD